MQKGLFPIFILLLALLIPGLSSAAGKPTLVLMPLQVSDVDKSMIASMETALVEGLSEKYKVFSGEKVRAKAKEIFNKESKAAVHKDCDETRCMQDIAVAFQAELIAVAAVTKRSDGFFIALNIKNIFDDTVVFSKSIPCEGCNEYRVVEKLQTLVGGGKAVATVAEVPSTPSIPGPTGGGFSLGDLDKQAKTEEERKNAEKAKWDKYLNEMKNAYSQVESYEKRDISKELKMAAWEKFLASYKEDDTFSSEDEELRKKAEVKLKEVKSTIKLTNSSYTDDGDGTVTASKTGLMWQKKDDNKERNWSAAGSYCDGLTLAGYSDWRLPSKDELVTLVDESKGRPTIDTTFFPDTKSSSYWSSTTGAASSSFAWVVYFSYGVSVNSNKAGSYCVRCVRGGQ